MEFDWIGFEKEDVTEVRGRIVCKGCGQRWYVPACWLNRPTPQCAATLGHHRSVCKGLQPKDGQAVAMGRQQ